MTGWTQISTASELVAAASDQDARIEVSGAVSGMAMIRLAPGAHLRGGELRFGAKGVQLTRDNVLEDTRIVTAEHELAILNDLSEATLGRLVLKDVETIGQVRLLAAGSVRNGRVDVDGLRVKRADVRGRSARPTAYGVEAMQGGFTLWNRQTDPNCVITATLLGIAAGSREAPMRGGGVFVAGSGPAAGRVEVDVLRTDEVHADGGIAPGTPDLISGGVFVLTGAHVAEVINEAPVTTYGANDMVLDNWGRAAKWTALGQVSYGASAIGFVNFGAIDDLSVRSAIETHGSGARGFNLYDGTLHHAYFHSIRTLGDGAVGIQVSKDLPEIEIDGDLVSSGGEGMSLVKGVRKTLKATALSIQKGGHVGRVAIGGRLATLGDGVVTLEVEGTLDKLEVRGGIAALGKGSRAVEGDPRIQGLERIAIETAARETSGQSIQGRSVEGPHTR